ADLTRNIMAIAGLIHDAGTVDQHVDGHLFLLDLLDQRLDRLRILHIEGMKADEQALGAQGLRRLLKTSRGPAGDEQPVAELSHLACGLKPEAPRAACDQGKRQTGHAKFYPRKPQ